MVVATGEVVRHRTRDVATRELHQSGDRDLRAPSIIHLVSVGNASHPDGRAREGGSGNHPRSCGAGPRVATEARRKVWWAPRIPTSALRETGSRRLALAGPSAFLNIRHRDSAPLDDFLTCGWSPARVVR